MTPDQCDHSALIRAGYRLRQGLAGRERDRLLGESADLETHCCTATLETECTSSQRGLK